MTLGLIKVPRETTLTPRASHDVTDSRRVVLVPNSKKVSITTGCRSFEFFSGLFVFVLFIYLFLFCLRAAANPSVMRPTTVVSRGFSICWNACVLWQRPNGNGREGKNKDTQNKKEKIKTTAVTTPQRRGDDDLSDDCQRFKTVFRYTRDPFRPLASVSDRRSFTHLASPAAFAEVCRFTVTSPACTLSCRRRKIPVVGLKLHSPGTTMCYA